jgi:sensor histidine kinase regulating citrate/malate metabolism
MEQQVEVLMEEYNLGFLTVTDAQGSVLMRAHALSRRGDSLIGERALEEALRGSSFVTIETSPVEKLSIRAAAPMRAGANTTGVVIVGYPLDNVLVDNIKRVTGLEMFIYDQKTATAATAFAANGRSRATGIVLQDSRVQAAVLERGVPTTADENLYGQPFMMGYLPLVNGDDKVVGMIAAGKSQQDILDIANSTNRLTLMTVILIMLVLVYPIFAFTRRLNDEL